MYCSDGVSDRSGCTVVVVLVIEVDVVVVLVIEVDVL